MTHQTSSTIRSPLTPTWACVSYRVNAIPPGVISPSVLRSDMDAMGGASPVSRRGRRDPAGG